MIHPTKRHLAQLYATRSCGECRACCTAVHVLELDKGPYVPCKHLGNFSKGEPGCTIYAERPKSCEQWACEWRGAGPLLKEYEERPDRCGVLLSTSAIHHPKLGNMRFFLVREAFEGGFEAPEARALVQRLSDLGYLCVMTTRDSRDVVEGPKELVMRWVAFMRTGGVEPVKGSGV